MHPSFYRVPDALITENPHRMIHRIDSSRFNQYGTLLPDLKVTDLLETAQKLTAIPQEGNVYVASLPELEALAETASLQSYFNGQNIQVGYCNGRNISINGAEYHKSPELFIAVTDCLQFLTPFNQLKDFRAVHTNAAELFYFPKGSVALIKEKVLHLAPLCVHQEGFKSIIVLPKGTNEPLDTGIVHNPENDEDKLLFKQNKWMLAHPDRIQLTSQGVAVGLEGENLSIRPLH
ncbi:MAG: DUF4867 family protein [Spirochaetales bacterium]|nr:DUF4867 family protein [Spirochaetales bacterium]